MTHHRPLSALFLVLATALPLALPGIVQAQPYTSSSSANGSAAIASAAIASFGIEQVPRLQPGEVLNFKLNGVPGASVSLQIAGATAGLRMTEVQPGRYEGDYTIRQKDRLTSASRVTARVLKDGRVSSATLGQSLVLGARAPTPMAAACARCGSAVSVNPVAVNSDAPNVIGTVAGGLLGGVLGHQVGGGSGKDLATVVDALGGAYAGAG